MGACPCLPAATRPNDPPARLPPLVLAPPRRRKRAIPKAVRAAVWNTYMGGEHVGAGPCFVCGAATISQLNFHCAHVVAEADGGQETVANLRPACATCNLSMGRKNLEAFKRDHFV